MATPDVHPGSPVPGRGGSPFASAPAAEPVLADSPDVVSPVAPSPLGTEAPPTTPSALPAEPSGGPLGGGPLGGTAPFGTGPAPFGTSTPELCLVLEGEMEIEEADGTRLSLRAGEVCTLTPGARRRAAAAGCEILLVDGAGRARTDRAY
ncbi:cupin domain-containing protein [Streptomyces alkaliphilus]|uniref:cupin domain-containing protein n=1 Tax=Streptomyces alkaliphilus TaxID=1472722 RepID=UPI0011805B8F|nr:cupin domain-containing protein [Streptomyces alkaliphilus]MQS06407.1 hypothetical protein [Streptomyces alkaliphilus]